MDLDPIPAGRAAQGGSWLVSLTVRSKGRNRARNYTLQISEAHELGRTPEGQDLIFGIGSPSWTRFELLLSARVRAVFQRARELAAA